jgi:hypothetical protein
VAAKKSAKKSAKRSAKKSASKPAKKSVKKAAAKRPVTKKSVAKKSATKRAPKKSSAKKSSAKKSATTVVRSTKIEIPTAPTSAKAPITPAAPAKSESVTATRKSSPAVLFMVIAGVVLLAIFALSNASTTDDAAPTASESPAATTSPTEEPSESESPAANLVYEAPTSFVAINNASGGVTLRWKAPAAIEGLTGYLISISYNAVDFKEVGTVPADQFSLDIARVGDEGGTQFFIQSVYSDGTKADGSKFSLRGKYE